MYIYIYVYIYIYMYIYIILYIYIFHILDKIYIHIIYRYILYVNV